MEVSGIKQGIPSWVELMTTDENAALAFYSGLFGWTDDAQPIPDGTVYHMQTLEGAAVAGLGAQQEQERQMGVPPHWNVYLAVDDLDQVANRVEGAGGSLMMPPMDVMDIGRMSFVQDPTGGMVGLWQAKLHQGFGRIREPGTVTWCELITDDPAKAGEFYSKVLDVPTEAMPMQDQGPYTLLGPAKEQGAGIMQKTAEMGQMPNVWGVYFEVADTDSIIAKAGELGGTVLSGPFDTMPGRIAMLADPQGAVFGVIKSNPMQM